MSDHDRMPTDSDTVSKRAMNLYRERLDEIKTLQVEEGVRINKNSEANLRCFIESNPEARQGYLFCHDDGVYMLQWSNDAGKYMSLEFIDSRMIRYFLLRPASEVEDKFITSGVIDRSKNLDVIKFHRFDELLQSK